MLSESFNAKKKIMHLQSTPQNGLLLDFACNQKRTLALCIATAAQLIPFNARG
jgi:hypothetical protein